jgi:hypothetical protein
MELNMKCHVCDGDIKVYNAYNFTKTKKYKPRCSKCTLSVDYLFPTPELALEAMRPKVSEGLTKFIISNICMELAYEIKNYDHTEADYKVIHDHIKQELEKFYNKK